MSSLSSALRAFLVLYHSTPTPAPLRRGQYLFNTLYTINPALAAEIRSGPLDPFYDDTRIDACLAHVILWWDKDD
jgi:hypothetical protein